MKVEHTLGEQEMSDIFGEITDSLSEDTEELTSPTIDALFKIAGNPATLTIFFAVVILGSVSFLSQAGLIGNSREIKTRADLPEKPCINVLDIDEARAKFEKLNTDRVISRIEYGLEKCLNRNNVYFFHVPKMEMALPYEPRK